MEEPGVKPRCSSSRVLLLATVTSVKEDRQGTWLKHIVNTDKRTSHQSRVCYGQKVWYR